MASLAPPMWATTDPAQIKRLRLCAALIGTHLITNAFVDLRPGVAPSDHLVSGTVPLAAIAAIAYGFGRTRAAVTATAAGLLGLSAVIAGSVPAAAIVVDGRITPGPITGVIGAISGVVLVVLSARIFHHTRRRGGGRLRRWGRRGGRGVLGAVLVVLAPWPVAAGYITANASHDNTLGATDLDPGYQQVTLRTADGLRLAAGYRPSANGGAVIVFPGRQPAHETLLAEHGYGVLVLTPRGRDGSHGDPHLLGWTGENDLRAAVRYLQSRPDIHDGRIGGLGLSVGGELLLQTAAHESALRAVIAEGAGTRWVAEDLHPPAPLLAVPISAMETLATAVFSDSMPPPRLQDVVADIAPRPIMLIFAPNGTGGEYNNPAYFQGAGDPKTLWEIPESGHTGGIAARPDEYEQRVVAFLDEALLEFGPDALASIQPAIRFVARPLAKSVRYRRSNSRPIRLLPSGS